MTHPPSTPESENDRQLISTVMQKYIAGAVSGRSEDLASAFHDNATIHGYVGPDLFGGPIAMFFNWHNENGPATDVRVTDTSIDVEGTIATVRMELDNWTGYRFTDMFTLLKTDGQWKIISKVFYMHDE